MILIPCGLCTQDCSQQINTQLLHGKCHQFARAAAAKCHRPVAQTAGLFPHSAEGGKSKIKVPTGLASPEVPPWCLDGCVLPVSSHALRLCVHVLISSSYQDPAVVAEGPAQ